MTELAGTQDIGRRSEQQDVWSGFLTRDGAVALLADGMGGMAEGRWAAQTAVTSARAKLRGGRLTQRALIEALEEAAQVVTEQAVQHGLEGKTGTTLIIAMIDKNRLTWAATGDSRLYIWRRGRLLQLTRDHNFALLLSGMVVSGDESAQDAMINRRRHALVSFLGMGKLRLIDHPEAPFDLENGDLVLLCSDGCYSAFAADMPLSGLNAQQVADLLVERAIAREIMEQDNATCVVLRQKRSRR